MPEQLQHVESELHQSLLLKVSRFRKRSSDRIKNRLEDTPFDKGTWREIFLPVNNCMVIELDVVLGDVVPTIKDHKQAAEVKRCRYTHLAYKCHTITIIIN